MKIEKKLEKIEKSIAKIEDKIREIDRNFEDKVFVVLKKLEKKKKIYRIVK